MRRTSSIGQSIRPMLLAGILAAGAAAAPGVAVAAPTDAAVADEAAAAKLLDAARRAFNEGKFQPAADRFREFLAKYAHHPEAVAASYGLGLSLLELPQRDYQAAADALRRAVDAVDFPERASAQYHLGVALRGVGNKAIADAAARPKEADALQKTVAERFADAAKQFADAQAAFTERAKGVPADAEWADRARCDRCEMLLRLGKHAEAADVAGAFLSDAALAKSACRPLGLYHLGCARFALKDYVAAGRALSQLAPFDQDFGPHARYLLARIHHLADERPEASAQYKGVVEGYTAAKKAAPQALQSQAKLDPERRAQLERIANGNAPDYVVRAAFYSAVLLYDDAKYGEAGDRFAAIVQQEAKNPLVPECKLRLGFCRLQEKKFPEAVRALEPLRDDAALGDRATWWLARAQLGAADPNNVVAREQAAKGAVDAIRRAIEKADKMADADPAAKVRRAEMQMDLGDAQQAAKQYKEAAETYGRVAADASAGSRAEEAAERRVTALHLARLFKESDAAASAFERAYPRSTLLAAVWFRVAENAYQAALAAADDDAHGAPADVQKLFDAALARYAKLVERYPEFEYVDLARQAMATAHARAGRYAEAVELLARIPEASRTGELATVPYAMADCLIRTLPPVADDALQAERLIETAEQAAKLLEAFAAANPKGAQAPDAMLKLGFCYQRVAAELASPDERKKTLTRAREVYDKCAQQFPNDAALPHVVLERGRCLALMGDAGAAANELRRFQADRLAKSPDAPLALVRLSSVLRGQDQAAAAVDVMKRCRADHEDALMKDDARRALVPMLKYEHAVALREAKKWPEARALFEEVIDGFPAEPDAANAAWRLVQCRRDALAEPLAEVRKVAARLGATAGEVDAAYTKLDEPAAELATAAGRLRARADELAKKSAGSDAHLRTLYELAWAGRTAGEIESDAARLKLQRAAVEKVRDAVAQQLGTVSPPPLTPPEVDAAELPVPTGELRAREDYAKLIAAAPTASPLAVVARFELAELRARRGEPDAALELLAAALLSNPSADVADRIKLRVAACLLARDDAPSALSQARRVLERQTPPPNAPNPPGPLAAEARYLVGEALIRQQDWPKAIETLTPFRDRDSLRNVPDVGERALLRLAFACAQAGQWDASRQACEVVTQRFGQGRWADEARFGAGWAMQNQKQYDQAVGVYTELTHHTAAAVAARAQVNVGVCRLEQKRPADARKALLAAAATYDYPEWTAAAWYHAGRAEMDDHQPDEAAKDWRRVVDQYPTTAWAELAKQRLNEMK